MKHTICLVLGSVLLVAGVKILSEEQALVAGTKQSRQAQLPCQPACLICLPVLFFAHYKRLLSKWIFAAATNSTNTQNRASGMCQ
jgi:hypothetical protein